MDFPRIYYFLQSVEIDEDRDRVLRTEWLISRLGDKIPNVFILLCTMLFILFVALVKKIYFTWDNIVNFVVGQQSLCLSTGLLKKGLNGLAIKIITFFCGFPHKLTHNNGKTGTIIHRGHTHWEWFPIEKNVSFFHHKTLFYATSQVEFFCCCTNGQMVVITFQKLELFGKIDDFISL